jgi:hypothetical protein
VLTGGEGWWVLGAREVWRFGGLEGWRGQGDYGYAIVNRYEMGFVYPYTTVTDVYINIIDHWFYGCQRILHSPLDS